VLCALIFIKLIQCFSDTDKAAAFILKNPPRVETSNETGKELNDDDDDWAPESLADQEKLSSQFGKFGLDTDLEKTTEERLEMLHRYFIKVCEAGIFGEGEELLNEAERLELKV
jgi:hypothetical protein